MKTKNLILLFTAIFLSITAISKDKNQKYDAATLVKKSLSLIGKNYGDSPNYMNAFYKEKIQQNNTCITTNEALLNIQKSSYLTSKPDLAAIAQIRGKCNPNENSGFMIKLQRGPITALELDILKKPFLGAFPHEIEESYTFEYSQPVTINNRELYVILFNQKVSEERTLYRGKIYIDKSTLAVSKIEYSMNIENKFNSSAHFLIDKPKGHDIKMISANYMVIYKEYEGKWYFDYSTSDLNFNIMNREECTYNTYNINTQIAVTNLVADNFTIDKSNLLKNSDNLTDKAKEYNTSSEWDIYNLILLTAAN